MLPFRRNLPFLAPDAGGPTLVVRRMKIALPWRVWHDKGAGAAVVAVVGNRYDEV